MRPRFAPTAALRRLVLTLAAIATGLALQGCVYRMAIQQGNFLEERAIEQLQVGMTRSQVRYLLGTPMVPDAFDEDRWDYLYYLKKGRIRAPERRHLIVYFQDDKVARFDNRASQPMPSADERQSEPAVNRPPAEEEAASSS